MTGKQKKVVIWTSVIVVFGGIGYLIYRKSKKLNTTIKQIKTTASNTNTEAPMYGTLERNNWNDLGGYRYVFSDGSQDYYLADGRFVEQRDRQGNLVLTAADV